MERSERRLNETCSEARKGNIRVTLLLLTTAQIQGKPRVVGSISHCRLKETGKTVVQEVFSRMLKPTISVLGGSMTAYLKTNSLQREVEYLFTNEDAVNFPHLGRLVRHGYNFVVVRRCANPQKPQDRGYTLACEIICSNGSELLHRRELLTPDFADLATLEHYTEHNMLNIMHKHFFGKELEACSA